MRPARRRRDSRPCTRIHAPCRRATPLLALWRKLDYPAPCPAVSAQHPRVAAGTNCSRITQHRIPVSHGGDSLQQDYPAPYRRHRIVGGDEKESLRISGARLGGLRATCQGRSGAAHQGRAAGDRDRSEEHRLLERDQVGRLLSDLVGEGRRPGGEVARGDLGEGGLDVRRRGPLEQREGVEAHVEVLREDGHGRLRGGATGEDGGEKGEQPPQDDRGDGRRDGRGFRHGGGPPWIRTRGLRFIRATL